MIKSSLDPRSLIQRLRNWGLALQFSKEEKCLKQGDWLASAGREQEAIAKFTEALELCPDLISAHVKRGFSYLSIKEYEAAKLDFDRYVDCRRDEPLGYLARAQARLFLGQYEECLQDCDAAISFGAWNSNLNDTFYRYWKMEIRALAHVTAARAHLKLGNYRAAETRCDRSIAIEPSSGAFHVRSVLRDRLGRLNESQEDLAESYRLEMAESNRPSQSLAGPREKSFLSIFESRMLHWLAKVLTANDLVPKVLGVLIALAVIVILHLLGVRREYPSY